jgi:glycosyltransferase involved in cell wall biosynthesis
MRILQVSSASTWGGGETHFFQLTEFLRNRGHDVVVAGRPNSPLKPNIELPFANSVDLLTAMRLRRLLKHHGFDIIHAHVARDYTISAAAACGLPRTKLVFTRHLLLPVRPHFLYRRVAAWIAPTSQIRDALARIAPKTSVVIPNWVDIEKFVYEERAIHTPVAIGLLGQISPHKGHDDAIEAMRRLPDGFKLLIAGQGETAYENRLKERATGLPIEFLGFVSPAQFFQRIDILIMPSWEEPFGIVLLEAMAAGVPVVATARGGPLEIISSPREGVLIPDRDPVALANAFQSLAADGERRLMIMRSARHRVENDFDIRVVVPKIEKLYEECL